MSKRLVVFLLLLCSSFVVAQNADLVGRVKTLVETPAIPGYEQELSGKIAAELQRFHPVTDNMGNVLVTLGSGSPRRLLATPLDEPGFIVSNITSDGYIRLQRLPQTAALPMFNELHSAQPMLVETRAGKWINGAMAGLSVHLQPGRQNPPNLNELDNMYLDIGARTAAETRTAGADLLSPVVISRTLRQLGGTQLTSPAVGDRFGAAALLQLLAQADTSKVKGTLIVAFVTQQWAGARGLQRVLEQFKPDELIYIGRAMRPAPPARQAQAQTAEAPRGLPTQRPGSGVLILKTGGEAGALGAELEQLGQQQKLAVATADGAPLIPRGYAPGPPLPARTTHLSVPIAWPSTPGEIIAGSDVAGIVSLLGSYLTGQGVSVPVPEAPVVAEPMLPKRPTVAPTPEQILKTVIEAYGSSGNHEKPARETVAALLPAWAKPTTDDAGNLILHWGNAARSRVLVVAHLDEIGYEVKTVRADGVLDLENKGGGYAAFFMGHAAMVHTSAGMRPGVIQMPEGWEAPRFEWPRGIEAAARLDVGASNPEDVAKLGIKVGDWVTIPKTYRNLAGTRASARSFDDRIGCAALISAAWALGPNIADRDITFVWSTGEELGLVGATEVAKRLAAQNKTPEYVFAIDTFVSSDSPIEIPRFADAVLGKGFVVRAVDNSNIAPLKDVHRVVTIAKAHNIDAQYGTTGGGNDGSAYVRYGAIDVALGWPLRYSHSPAEVVDTHDLDELGKVITAIAKEW